MHTACGMWIQSKTQGQCHRPNDRALEQLSSLFSDSQKHYLHIASDNLPLVICGHPLDSVLFPLSTKFLLLSRILTCFVSSILSSALMEGPPTFCHHRLLLVAWSSTMGHKSLPTWPRAAKPPKHWIEHYLILYCIENEIKQERLPPV